MMRKRALRYTLAGVVAGLAMVVAQPSPADCQRTIADAHDDAPDTDYVEFTGDAAERFRLFLNSLDPINTNTGKIFQITQHAEVVRVYWMRPLAHVIIDGGRCNWLTWTVKDHVAGWLLHRVKPDEYPEPVEYRTDGA